MTHLETADVYLDHNDFLCIRFTGKVEMTLAHAVAHEKAILKECKGRGRAFLVDARGNYSLLTPEAREYMAKSEAVNEVRLVEAILVNNLPNRLTANAFAKINKPNCEVKVFADEAKAVQWLKQSLANLKQTT